MEGIQNQSRHALTIERGYFILRVGEETACKGPSNVSQLYCLVILAQLVELEGVIPKAPRAGG